jgi:hypothetical protein
MGEQTLPAEDVSASAVERSDAARKEPDVMQRMPTDKVGCERSAGSFGVRLRMPSSTDSRS